MLIRLLSIGVLVAGLGFAQRGGGMTDASGSRSGDSGMMGQSGASTLDRMASACNLSKDQRKQFTAVLDAASKSAAPLRKQAPLSREQIAAAAQAGKSPDEIRKLVEAGGLVMAQMTQLEMKAFGQLYNLLDADQRKTGGQQVFNMMGPILLKKNWNQ
jgi:Spy/CpxP family protein refolding chaperone